MDNLTKVIIGGCSFVAVGSFIGACVSGKKRRNMERRLITFCNETYKTIISGQQDTIKELNSELKDKKSEKEEG